MGFKNIWTQRNQKMVSEQTLISSTPLTVSTSWQKLGGATNGLMRLIGAEKITAQLEATINDSEGLVYRVVGEKGNTGTYDKAPSTKTLSDGSGTNTTMTENHGDANFDGNLDFYLDNQLKNGYIEVKCSVAGATPATIDYCFAIVRK